MNYLVTEGFVDAALEFQQECPVSEAKDSVSQLSEECVELMRKRMAIKNAIHEGNVDAAMEMLKFNFQGQILERNPDLMFKLMQLKLVELIREGKVDEALLFAQEELAPHAERNEQYLHQLERTMTLLAFDTNAIDSVTELLSPHERQLVASQVNEAILLETGYERENRLSSLLRLLGWAQEKLSERVTFPQLSSFTTNFFCLQSGA